MKKVWQKILESPSNLFSSLLYSSTSGTRNLVFYFLLLLWNSLLWSKLSNYSCPSFEVNAVKIDWDIAKSTNKYWNAISVFFRSSLNNQTMVVIFHFCFPGSDVCLKVCFPLAYLIYMFQIQYLRSTGSSLGV